MSDGPIDAEALSVSVNRGLNLARRQILRDALDSFANNLTVAAALCRAFELGDRTFRGAVWDYWEPGCGEQAL